MRIPFLPVSRHFRSALTPLFLGVALLLAYGAALVPLLAPGAVGLILTGNAREPNEDGPPVVSEEEIRAELGRYFQIRQLREFT